jgi:hypothetical protein
MAAKDSFASQAGPGCALAPAQRILRNHRKRKVLRLLFIALGRHHTFSGSYRWMDLSRVGIYDGSAGGQNAMRAMLDHADFYRAAAAGCGCHDNRMDKIWWNEAWMGVPDDGSYVKSSNVEGAHKLGGALLLTVGELDKNVDPASTYQVVNALQKAGKAFEFMPMIGALGRERFRPQTVRGIF